MLFLGGCALAAVGGLGWHAVVNGSESAINSLSMIATGAIGALAGMLSRDIAGKRTNDQQGRGER